MPMPEGPREVAVLSVQRQSLQLGDGEWWAAEVLIPATAAVLDFVLSDSAQTNWDNNGSKDFHTAVADALDASSLQLHLIQALEVIPPIPYPGGPSKVFLGANQTTICIYWAAHILRIVYVQASPCSEPWQCCNRWNSSGWRIPAAGSERGGGCGGRGTGSTAREGTYTDEGSSPAQAPRAAETGAAWTYTLT